MAFKKGASLAPWGGPILRYGILQNDDVFIENDMCKPDSNGFLTTDSMPAAGLFGHVDSLVTFDGVGLTSNGAGGTFSGTYTAAAANQTVAKVSATVDVSQFTIYSASLDATIGSTTGSDLLGYYMDLADQNDLDETAITTAAQMFNWGTDPADSTRAFVNIFESVVFTTV